MKCALISGFLILIASTHTFAADAANKDALTFGGFIDYQFRFNRGNVKVTDSLNAAGSKSTFTLNQAALYLSKGLEGAKVFVDLPFRQSAATGSTTNNFEFATTQAQAYITKKYDTGVFWQAGQYDTVYGFEGNDTKDLLFTRQGLVYALLPVTHSGLRVGFEFGTASISFLLGNANQKGQQTPSDNPEAGAKLAWNVDNYRLGLGYLVNKQDGDYTLSGQNYGYQTNQIADFLAGASFGNFNIDLGLDLITPKQGKVVSPTGVVEDKKNTTAILMQLSYECEHHFTTALRFENVQQDAGNDFTTAISGNGNGSDISRASLGVKHAVTAELALKADLNCNIIKASDSASAVTSSYLDGAVAALYVW